MRLYDYAGSGNCYKVRLLLALLGREYERVPVDIFAGDTLTDAFAALNPVRETPVLELQERVMGGIGGPRFRRLTGRPPIEGRLATGEQALALLDDHLRDRDWLVGERCTIADVAVFGYGHVAAEAGLAPGANVLAWMERLRALPGFVDDLEPYGDNARAGAGRSIYG